MRYLKRITIYISLLILVSGCGNSKEAEIKQNFNKTLSMYPIKNLENFYDKEAIEMKSLIKRIKELG